MFAEEIVSLKSHQPYAASLKEPGGFLAALITDINALAAFEVGQLEGTFVRANAGTRRILEVEIPPDTIAAASVGRPAGDPTLRAQFRREAMAAAARARAAHAMPDAQAAGDIDALWRRAVEGNVLEQVANLMSFPHLAEAHDAGRLTLHGWVYDLFTLRLRVYDRDRDAFVPSEEMLPPR